MVDTCRKPLLEVCDLLDSKRVPVTSNKRIHGPYPYYGANGIQDYVNDYIFDDDLVLLAEDGGNFGSKDKPIAYRVSGKCWVNNHAHVLKPREGLNVDYLCYSLMYYDTKRLVNGATRKKLTQAAMKNIKIPILAYNEQLKIVKRIAVVSTLIKNRKKELGLLDELVKSRFLEMFGEPWVNDKEFPCYSVGQVAESVTYGTSAPASDSGQYEYLRMNNLTDNGQLDLSDLKRIDMSDEQAEKYMVKKGDILFNRTNSIDLVGKTALFNLNNPMIIAGYLIRIRLSDKVNPVYFVAYMNMPYMKEKLRNIAKGAVNQANINSKELKSIQILIPPLSLQNEYCNFVLSIDKSKYREAIFLYLLEDIRICCNI